MCDRICRSSFGLYNHQRNYTENNLIIIIGARSTRACTGGELDDSDIHVSDKTDDNTRDVSNRTGHLNHS